MSEAERAAAQQAFSLARAEDRARQAHQRGLRAGAAGHPAVGARQLRAGLTALGWAEQDGPAGAAELAGAHHALAARLLMSLAHFEAEQGRTGYGLGLLDRAEILAAPGDRGILLYQRGLVFMRMRRDRDALALFDQAVMLLQDYPDAAHLARSLLNRGFSHLNIGDVRRARADLRRCERIAAGHGFGLIAAKAVHNQGYCDLLAGDIPAALQRFTTAAESYRRRAPGNLPVLAMDKARALLAAGLAGDAASELDGAITAFRRQRLDQDHADAELARSQAALAAGDLDTARRWAAAAERRFARRGNEACACLAELTRLRARSAAIGRGRAMAPIGSAAARLAERLRGLALGNDADVAELIAARAMIAAGRGAEAGQRIALVHRRRAVSLDVSLLRRLAKAELAELEGRPGAALGEFRAGLALVHARRGRLGSIDLQTGTAALGADLAAGGLRLALDRGSAPLVFAWLERSRAQAFLVRPVRPPADPRAAAALAELRQLSRLIRNAELTGHRDPAVVARHAQLQREIREHSWQIGGFGETIPQASLGEVRTALAESGQQLVAVLARGRQLHAVLLGGGPARLVRLGDTETVTEAARRLSADLDTIAGRRPPARLAAVISQSIRQQTAVLSAQLIDPLRRWLGGDGVVLVVGGALAGIPWSLLPGLCGRPVTVCPSASAWLAAWRRGQAATPGTAHPPVLVAGPDLQHAPTEVAEIAKIYPGCQPLVAGKATVAATLRSLDGAPIAHLAAHGHHDRENVLFSRLDLADGPLMAYDIERLAAAPRQVILSACDVGRTVVRPGDEVLGFTAALLYAGTATVISSVTRVSDDAAVAVMTAYHRALRAGARPAAALAEAAGAEPLSPFVCFGSG
jgi:tetratricopeptide (TPR) repeat protein